MFRIRIALLLLISISPWAHADKSAMEYKVKAAYIYNFTKFITWPQQISEQFNICVIGENPFGNLLEPLRKRTVSGAPIVVEYLAAGQSLKHCHIAYFEMAEYDADKSGSNEAGILTITSLERSIFDEDVESQTERSSVITFLIKNDRVKLRINVDAAKAKSFKISAKLLELAELVGNSYE